MFSSGRSWIKETYVICLKLGSYDNKAKSGRQLFGKTGLSTDAN